MNTAHIQVLAALLWTALAITVAGAAWGGKIKGEVRIALPASTHSIPANLAQVRIESGNAIVAESVTDPDGFFVIANLPPGSYLVTAQTKWDSNSKAIQVGKADETDVGTLLIEPRYWVIVGSARSREEADLLVKSIKKKAPNVEPWVGIESPGTKLYPVIVGQFLPYGDAKALKQELLAKKVVADAYLSPGTR